MTAPKKKARAKAKVQPKIKKPLKLVNGNTPLINACRAGDINLVKKIAEEEELGLDLVSPAGFTAFEIATKKGYTEITNFLLTLNK